MCVPRRVSSRWRPTKRGSGSLLTAVKLERFVTVRGGNLFSVSRFDVSGLVGMYGATATIAAIRATSPSILQ